MTARIKFSIKVGTDVHWCTTVKRGAAIHRGKIIGKLLPGESLNKVVDAWLKKHRKEIPATNVHAVDTCDRPRYVVLVTEESSNPHFYCPPINSIRASVQVT